LACVATVYVYRHAVAAAVACMHACMHACRSCSVLGCSCCDADRNSCRDSHETHLAIWPDLDCCYLQYPVLRYVESCCLDVEGNKRPFKLQGPCKASESHDTSGQMRPHSKHCRTLAGFTQVRYQCSYVITHVHSEGTCACMLIQGRPHTAQAHPGAIATAAAVGGPIVPSCWCTNRAGLQHPGIVLIVSGLPYRAFVLKE
jgi:hypothetical protein